MGVIKISYTSNLHSWLQNITWTPYSGQVSETIFCTYKIYCILYLYMHNMLFCFLCIQPFLLTWSDTLEHMRQQQQECIILMKLRNILGIYCQLQVWCEPSQLTGGTMNVYFYLGNYCYPACHLNVIAALCY